MKNILIVADGIVAKHFLERLFVSRSSAHHYVVIACGDEDYSDINLEITLITTRLSLWTRRFWEGKI